MDCIAGKVLVPMYTKQVISMGCGRINSYSATHKQGSVHGDCKADSLVASRD